MKKVFKLKYFVSSCESPELCSSASAAGYGAMFRPVKHSSL